MAEQNVGLTSPIPGSALTATGPFFGGPIKPPREEPVKIENPFETLDLESLETFFKNNPSTWQQLGYGPKGIIAAEPEGFKTYADPDAAIGRFVYEELIGNPYGTYDQLFGVGGEQPMLPRDALAAMSQYRNVTGIEAFKEQLPRYLLTSAAGLGLGAGTIPLVGGNMLLAGTASILGSIAADTGFRIFSPESPINQPYLPGTNAETGEFISALVGGGAPFLAAPWTIPAKQQITLGTNAIGRNLQRWRLTGGERIPEALRRIDDAYVESMRTARQSPNAFLTSEGTALAVSGVAGTAAMQLPDETPGKNLIVFGSELLSPMLVSPSAVLNSASYLKQRGTELFSVASAPMTEQGRTRGFTEALIAAMVEVQNITDPEEADAYVKQVVENLRAADPRLTSGLAGDDPVLKILENRLVGRNPEITAMYTDANRVYNGILDGLRQQGDPQSLQLRADFLLARDQEVIWQTIADRYKEYNTLRDRALRSNSDFDDGKEFRNFFVNPDTGLLSDIRRQRKLLREAIPKDIVIDPATLSLLTDEYARVKNRLTVGDAEGRLSSGRDLVSLDQAFKSITPAEAEEVTETTTAPVGRRLREEAAKLQTEFAKLNEEIRGLTEKRNNNEINQVERARLEEAKIRREGLQEDIKTNDLEQEALRKQTAPVEAAQQEDRVTTGQLLVLLSTLDQAIGTNNFRPDANELLTNALDELRAQTLDVLRITDNRVLASEIELGAPTSSSLALSDYLAFEEASSSVFSNTFLGEIRRKVSPEKVSSALFDSFKNTPLIRLQQLDEAVNLLNTFNAERSGSLQLRVDDERRRRENLLAGMDPATRTRVETLEQALDDPSREPAGKELPIDYGSASAALTRLLQGQSFTPGQLERLDELIVNPEGGLLDLRAMEERLLRGFLRNGDFWERVPRLDPETGKPVVKMVNIPGSDRQFAEEVVDYLPTGDFYSFLEDNKQAIQQFFPSVYADMMDANMANQAIKAAIGEIPTKSASDRNAFFRHMMEKADENDIPEYRTPNALINTIVGEPGKVSDIEKTNAHVTLRSVIDNMFDGVEIDTPEGLEIRDGFLQAVFNNASIYSNDPKFPTTDGIHAPAYFDYLFQPINAPRVEKPGANTRSVMNILLESGLIDQEHYLNIRRTTEAFKELSNLQQGKQAKFEEIGGLTGQEAEERFVPGIMGKASGLAGSFLLGVGGSALGTRLYNLFTGGIAGPGSIRAAGTGVEAFRNLFTNLPASAQNKMFSDMFTDKEVLATALEMYNNPERLDELLTADRIGTLYTWFAGAGLQMSPSEFFAEFGKEYVSPEDEAELQARENRAEAIRTRGRQPGNSPFAIQRPAPQQAQARPVTPPPVAQAPVPTFQTPAPTAQASPVSRQQYAAAFPDDFTSDLIRSQGIGSLNRTA